MRKLEIMLAQSGKESAHAHHASMSDSYIHEQKSDYSPQKEEISVKKKLT